LWQATISLAGTLQQLLKAWSIKFADFGVIDPGNFLKLVWAALFGFTFVAEVSVFPLFSAGRL